MVTIVDYGMGNLRSVQKAFEKLGTPAHITDRPEEIARAEKLVLPGVGAFCDAMDTLNRQQLIEPIRDFLATERPFFGICLGLQMLFERSLEDGDHAGLGILKGKVVRFELPHEFKVPHMGWNRLRVRRLPPVLEGLPPEADVYFVHSYYVVPEDESVIATETDHGHWFTSMVWRDNLFATQFHPEKSQAIGLHILQRFAAL